MDGVAIVRRYVDRIIHGDGKLAAGNSGSNMKVLLLDAATTQTVAAVYSQTEILNESVYLVTTLEKQQQQQQQFNSTNRESSSNSSSHHLKAVCFLRPTAANVDALCGELQRQPQPRYQEYHVFFSGQLSTGLLRKLADADACEHGQRVRQLQEFYADFLPLAPDLWTLPCRHTLAMTVSAGTSWAPKHAVQYERHLQGLQAMLLALRRRPASIRYAAASPCAEELARDLQDAIEQQPELFQFRHTRGTGGTGGGLLLLILDRRDDPVTPLLSQWTYQAMVHELLGLNNHRVVLKGAPGVDSKDLEEVVLQDDFFRAHRHKNFGELGEEIQRLLQEYQKQTAQVHTTTKNLNSIQDMQQFMDKFPELRSRSHTVSKHVAILGELARLVQVCHLMDVSQLEQTLAYAYSSDDHSAHWRELLEKLHSTDIKMPDKLRLGLLYALRYENTANLHMLQQAMGKGGVPPDLVQLLPVLLRYGGRQQRGPGLFGDRGGGDLVSRVTKNIVGAVQGVDNVYSQHVPLLMDILQQAVRGKLSPRDYPTVVSASNNSGGGSGSNGGSHHHLQHHHPQQQQQHHHHHPHELPTEILVFVVGGVTYEEGTKVAEFNAQHRGRGSGVQVVLAGSTVHNSTSFLDELKATAL